MNDAANTGAGSSITAAGPSTLSSLGRLYQLFLRGQLTRLRAVGLFVLSALAIVLTAVSRGADDPLDASTIVIAEYGLGIVAPVCTLWIASSLLGDLNEDRLLVYLWLKPIPRWLLPTAALGATVTIMVPVVVVPLAIAAAVSGESVLVAPTIAATLLAIAAYGAVFVAFGARFSKALWWGLLYLLVWETAIARIGDISRFSIRSYPVSLLSRATEVRLDLDGRAEWAAVAIPLVLVVAGVVAATAILNRRDID